MGATGIVPQRWARWAGWFCLLGLLPSALWRITMLAGLPGVDTGFAEAELYRSDAVTVAYVLGLDAAQLVFGGLCLGLVRPWGERLPAWVPGLGGRVIHRAVPTVLGGVGALLLYVIMGELLITFGGVWLGLTEGWTPAAAMSPGQATILGVAYTPFFLWPVALTVALVGYWRRRSPTAGHVDAGAGIASVP